MVEFSYGNADFASLRRAGCFYVDKTPFLPLLESPTFGGKNLIFLRPRRFGKSSLLSMMKHYYDISMSPEYDELFGGLWIHDHPTPERSQYLVLHLNFSTVTTSSDETVLQANFLTSLQGGLNELIERYRHRLASLERFEQQMGTFTDPAALMNNLLGIIAGTKDKLYVLIDEYDTFANALLSADQTDLYSKITDKFGFVRAFYRALKAGADSGAIGRVFITGGTPILLDDLVTGFNIVTNISNAPRFNALAGFTRAEVERAVDELLRDIPSLIDTVGDRNELIETLERFYDGYRFSIKARDRVFNSTLVIYCLRELANSGEYPTNMLDVNARTDYQKLHRLWASAGPAADERRAALEQILSEGKVSSPLVERFGMRTEATTSQFVSLMYYTGMLTLAPEPPNLDVYHFEPPNRVIRDLSWEHYTRLLEDLQGLVLRSQPIALALLDITHKGDLEPFLDLLRKTILPVLSVRDLRKHDEKAMKMLLIGIIVTAGLFHVLSEKEFAQGFNDLFITPVPAVHVGKYAWMFELKYVTTDASEDAKNAAFEQAEAQLERYMSDPNLVPMLTRGLGLKAGTMLFVGGKEVVFREYARTSA
ncbi:MAG: AAA family ATPase [Polyangiaceae bacterium]|nr:AAA family ATPase [Polyangiaceae bacterium]